MKDEKGNWKEIVIIPHPNELKKIADFQRQLCARLSHGGEIWMPCFPLYVRGWFDGGSLADLRKRICACTLKGARKEDDRIVLDAEIIAGAETMLGSMEIARKVRKTQEDSDTAALKDGEPFPMRLPVFRLAQIEFTQTDARTEWTVTESAWVKEVRIHGTARKDLLQARGKCARKQSGFSARASFL